MGLSLQLESQTADSGSTERGGGAGVTLVQPETASPEVGTEHQHLSTREENPERADQAERPFREDGWDLACAGSPPEPPMARGRPLRVRVGGWTERSQSGPW